MTSPGSVSIIVPTRNEVENIETLVRQLMAQGAPLREILFVDDRSKDGTRELIQSLAPTYPVRLVDQDQSMPGLAAAIMAGARAADGEWLLVMDADLSHPPDKINELLAPLFDGTADLVIGSRYVEGGTTAKWPFWRRTLSRAGAGLAFLITGVHDSMCGFFAIKSARLLEICPPAVGFKIVFETIARSKGTLRVREIPIEFRDRARGQSKMSFGIALRFFWRWFYRFFRQIVSVRGAGSNISRDIRVSEQAKSRTDRTGV